MKHVVMFSGGIGSWATAKRVAQRHGTDNLTLLFADVKGNSASPHVGEDEDLYRFLLDASRNVGAPLVRVADGRTIWDVFRDTRYLGNSRIAPCSKVLKKQPLTVWLKANCNPDETIVYLGIDWAETHRVTPARKANAPYRVEFPLLDRPLLDKPQLIELARDQGLTPPRLYEWGFAHNNCGGGCVRSGQRQFVELFKAMPDRYDEWARQEELIQTYLDARVTILTRTVRGETRNVSLRQLREEVELQPRLIDESDWGACQCFADDETVYETVYE